MTNPVVLRTHRRRLDRHLPRRDAGHAVYPMSALRPSRIPIRKRRRRLQRAADLPRSAGADRRPVRRCRRDLLPRRHARRPGHRGGTRRQACVLREADGADAGRRGPGHRAPPTAPGWRCRSDSTAASPTDFAAMRNRIVGGAIGTPQMLRSLTRDPGISADVAARVKPWTIFNETLIHDFDTLCWLNPDARVTRGLRSGRCADPSRSSRDARASWTPPWSSCASTTERSRLPRPASRPSTATTCAVRFSAPTACCWRDARPTAQLRATPTCSPTPTSRSSPTSPTASSTGTEPSVTGRDARVALEIAIAARESVRDAARLSPSNGVLQ